VDVPTAGMALANMSRNGSYEAARRGALGVPVIEVGGKKRVPSIAVLRALGLVESTTNKTGTRKEVPVFFVMSRKPAVGRGESGER
jgi:hypothetical protein